MLSCNKNNHPKVNFCLQKEKFAPLLHLPIRHIEVLRELLTRSGFDESWLAPFDTTLYLKSMILRWKVKFKIYILSKVESGLKR